MVNYGNISDILSYLVYEFNSDDFKKNYVNEDNTFTDEFKNYVKKAVKESFKHIGNERNNKKRYGNGPVSSSLTEIKQEQQIELIDNYLNTMLDTIKFGTPDYIKLANSIIYAYNEVANDKTKDPSSVFSVDVGDNFNILRNISYYILNYYKNKEQVLYSNTPEKISPNVYTTRVKQIIAQRNAEEMEKLKKEREEARQRQQNSNQKIVHLETVISDQGEKIKKGIKIVDDLQDENTNLKGKLNDAQILRNEVNEVKADIKQLLKKNKSDILNDVALTLAGNPDLKKNIRKIKGDLKASNPSYSDGDINYIITKALSENERYLKTVAANPDLFERDMSNDTIQKENEKFQSKLRQQNLRYILPKFIERRDKLVENTLNPNLLKGAFAV